MTNPDTQFKDGNTAAVKSGFFVDNILPCKNDLCSKFSDCPHKNSVFDDHKIARCLEEIEFFEETTKTLKEEFNLDKKDLFQLPLMIMRMIKIKRQNRYEANNGVVSKSLVFNPKTGEERQIDVPNILNRDVYYAEKALMNWLESLKMSRSSRDASAKLDIFNKILSAKS
jgi:hypothetical protein